MKSLPDEFDERLIGPTIAEAWGFHVRELEYADVGFGSYHWVLGSANGDRAFATVDDLDRKPWLGNGRESVFRALRSCFDTAASLRELGLEFVVAPIRARDGETTFRLGARHAVALFPFVDGRAHGYGDELSSSRRAALVEALRELHRAPVAVDRLRRGADLAASGELRTALDALGEPWTGGPFSEPARRALARHAKAVQALLSSYDDLAARVDVPSCPTHGEPHPGNVIGVERGIALVDWDTIAFAPPERDLWMLGEEDRARYAELTEREPDRDALELFRLAWDVNDLAAWSSTFRSTHRESDDTATEYGHFDRLLQSLERRGG